MVDDREIAQRRTRTDYENAEMMKYGACHICGGPRTAVTSVTGRPGVDLNVSMGGRCLWCGSEIGREDAVPAAEAEFVKYRDALNTLLHDGLQVAPCASACTHVIVGAWTALGVANVAARRMTGGC